MEHSEAPVRAAKRHGFACGFAASILACALASAAAPAMGADIDPQLVAAAKKEGRVTLYSPLIVDQVVRPLVAAFRAKYGVQVDFIRMDSDAVVLKVINEYRAHRATADIFTTSLGIEPLIASGALRKFRTGNVDELPAQYKD